MAATIEGASDEYRAEVNVLAQRAAERLPQMGVAQLALNAVGDGDQPPRVRQLTHELITQRRQDGYYLSAFQVNQGLALAGHILEQLNADIQQKAA